jgi:hypothetical protein
MLGMLPIGVLIFFLEKGQPSLCINQCIRLLWALLDHDGGECAKDLCSWRQGHSFDGTGRHAIREIPRSLPRLRYHSRVVMKPPYARA